MQNCLFCTFLALVFCLFSNYLVLKDRGFKFPTDQIATKNSVCQPVSCLVYFSKRRGGGVKFGKSEEGASSFVCHDQGAVNF